MESFNEQEKSKNYWINWHEYHCIMLYPSDIVPFINASRSQLAVLFVYCWKYAAINYIFSW